MLPFKANYGQDPRMGFEGRKKGKYMGVEKFVKKIKEIQKEVKVALGKMQKDMKKYVNKKRAEVEEYKVGDLVMLSTKDLKYQIVRRRTGKLYHDLAKWLSYYLYFFSFITKVERCDSSHRMVTSCHNEVTSHSHRM